MLTGWASHHAGECFSWSLARGPLLKQTKHTLLQSTTAPLISAIPGIGTNTLIEFKPINFRASWLVGCPRSALTPALVALKRPFTPWTAPAGSICSTISFLTNCVPNNLFMRHIYMHYPKIKQLLCSRYTPHGVEYIRYGLMNRALKLHAAEIGISRCIIPLCVGFLQVHRKPFIFLAKYKL